MAVCQNIKERLMPVAEASRVRDVRIGLGYTAVMLETGQTGVAYTFRDASTRRCTFLASLDPLVGKKASDLLGLLVEKDEIPAAVALATANALVNTMRTGLREGDILEHLHILPEDKVGMVGFFAPLVPRLKKKAASLFIFERITRRRGDLLPEKEAHTLLPRCEVALITGTSIVNHTIDDLLVAARSCRQVVILGPSTPLLPEAFTGTAVDLLSGVIVTNPPEVLRIVSEGRGMRFFKNNIKKVNLPLKQQESGNDHF